MLLLKPPVPMPMIINPTEKRPKAPDGLSITLGMDEQMSRM